MKNFCQSKWQKIEFYFDAKLCFATKTQTYSNKKIYWTEIFTLGNKLVFQI